MKTTISGKMVHIYRKVRSSHHVLEFQIRGHQTDSIDVSQLGHLSNEELALRVGELLCKLSYRGGDLTAQIIRAFNTQEG